MESRLPIIWIRLTLFGSGAASLAFVKFMREMGQREGNETVGPSRGRLPKTFGAFIDSTVAATRLHFDFKLGP